MIIIISNSPFIVTVSLVSCFVFYSYMVRVCDYGFFSVAFMFAFLRIPWRMTAFLCTRMTQLRKFHCARTPQLLHYCSTIMCVLNFQEELAVWWIDQPKSKSLTHALSVLYSHVTLETTPYFSPLANSLEPGSSAPNKKKWHASQHQVCCSPSAGVQTHLSINDCGVAKATPGKDNSRDTSNYVPSSRIGMFPCRPLGLVN